ncbi:hypothetical protein [Candidatus Odyssella thessalonicensis]|uniref:hypothetical protein n=1 Tax=Candidatus Odyssella thessalonicensis TaxID=84647 RepID=UPI00031CA20D|nr:hypothetical protein [Candidatus Odyssella thessalonicensis]
MQNLKFYVNSWAHQELVFCYSVTCSASSTGIQLTLHQKQTGFSLKLILQTAAGCLRICEFKLEEDPRLSRNSASLYEAALIEIVLHSVLLSIYCAQLQHKEEVIFMVTPEDAADLMPIEDLFDSQSSYLTAFGKRHIFTLYTNSFYLDDLIDHVNSIKVMLGQHLWSCQRTDRVLRNYLQHPNRREESLLSKPRPLYPRPKVHLEENVIFFPRVLTL